MNEYVYPETAAETVEVKKLEQQVEILLEKNHDVAPSIVAALGAYRPLHGYSWSRALRDRDCDDAIKDVVERQISEPFAELSLRPQITSLTPIKDAVSQSVREQYEENPYPRWIRTALVGTGKPIGTVLSSHPHHFDLSDYQSPECPEILIAGCGTGQHAVTAGSRFKSSRVLAVDLSLSSLSYAKRKTDELDLSNTLRPTSWN
jgi:SAM-dependent methyltransferase